ncbi:MAG: two-component sensor histidine kinase [Azospirillum sp.]|nr:two-component sensor histidine kinase [Azospirillum sp.]
MADPAPLFDAALALTVAGGLFLGLLIWRKARPVAGARPLIGFVTGTAAGVFGLALISWVGPAAMPVSAVLIAASPLVAAAFLHFAVAFGAGTGRNRGVLGGYGFAAVATLAAWGLGIGEVRPWMSFADFFRPGTGGWLAVGATAVLAAAGHGILALAWRAAAPMRRRQIAAVMASGLLGLAACTGFLFPALGLDVFPLPALLLPGYPVVLVYGILRYQFMEVNPWACRAVTWLMLMAVLAAVTGALAALAARLGAAGLPFWPSWGAATAGLVAAALLWTPLRALADRLVYPGGRVDPADLERWRAALATVEDLGQLAERAGALLAAHVGTPVTVTVAGEGPDEFGPAAGLRLSDAPDGRTCSLVGWHDAPPGPRHAAQLFAGVLAEAAQRLDRAQQLAAAFTEQRRQAYLAELGTLAASIAHDLRNPLNIVAMAAADAAPAVRAEIREQLQRMDRLIGDLLDYAGAWRVERRRLVLADEVDAALAGHAGTPVVLEIPDGLAIEADARALRRVLVNLIANADAALAGRADDRILVSAEAGPDGTIRLDVADRGQGVPGAVRDQLFQPFVSRRPGGTGLGLAIVARIMAAHGGSVRLSPKPGWTTCFSLWFPAAAAQGTRR